MSFEFGLPSIIAYSQRNITVPRQVRSCRRFLQDKFILPFSLKNMSCSMLPNCLLFNPLHSYRFQIRNMHRIQKWFMLIKQVYFVFSKQEGNISSRSSHHFVPKDQNKLCTHDKKRKRAELWVKNNLFNVFVMYALGSVHEKFDVWIGVTP